MFKKKIFKNAKSVLESLPCIAIALIGSAASAADLKVVIKGLDMKVQKSSKARLHVALHHNLHNANDLLSNNTMIAGEDIPARNGVNTVSFSGLEQGKHYAVIGYHDANGNEKLDRNFMGIPKEGYFASNNTRGQPKFKKTSFLMDYESKTITVSIRY